MMHHKSWDGKMEKVKVRDSDSFINTKYTKMLGDMVLAYTNNTTSGYSKHMCTLMEVFFLSPSVYLFKAIK